MKYCDDKEFIKKYASSIKLEEFKPKKITIKLDDKNNNAEDKVSDDDEFVIEKLYNELYNAKIER